MSYPTYGAPGYGYAPMSTPPLGFAQALRLAWRRKFEIAGRSRRSEYWWLVLATFLAGVVVEVVAVVLVVIGVAIGHGVQYVTDAVSALALLAVLVALVIVGFTASIRRLHDTDRSGWWVLINLVPSVGGIVLLVFELLEGTPGPNRFGGSPKLAAIAGSGYTGAQEAYGEQLSGEFGQLS